VRDIPAPASRLVSADAAWTAAGIIYHISLASLLRQIGCNQTLLRYDTIRYDKMEDIFTCAQKLANSQLNLQHGTKQKRLMKKMKIKTEMLRRNGPVIKPWSHS